MRERDGHSSPPALRPGDRGRTSDVDVCVSPQRDRVRVGKMGRRSGGKSEGRSREGTGPIGSHSKDSILPRREGTRTPGNGAASYAAVNSDPVQPLEREKPDRAAALGGRRRTPTSWAKNWGTGDGDCSTKVLVPDFLPGFLVDRASLGSLRVGRPRLPTRARRRAGGYPKREGVCLGWPPGVEWPGDPMVELEEA